MEFAMGVVRAVWNLLRYSWRILRAIVSALKWCYRLIKGQKKLTTHGDASWATDKEIRKAGAFEPGGFLLLRTKSGKNVYSKPNRGALVLAAPDAGKSTLILANFRSKALMHPTQRQHLIVHDPANELFTRGNAILEETGYLSAKIDLVQPSLGIRYDVQSFPKVGTVGFDGDVASLCENLVEAEPGSRQPHFVDYARKMLADVIVLNLVYEGGKRSLPECVDELVNETKRKALIKRMGKVAHDFNAIDIFQKMSGPEGTAMLSTSLRKLSPWTMETIRRVSDTKPNNGNVRGWCFEDMLNSDKPCVLFIRTGLSPGMGDFARVVFANAINTIRRQYDTTGMANPRGMQTFIDEAAKLGRCPALIDGHDELRKAGYSQLLSYVSLSAMKKSWGQDDAENLFNGCDHLILPGNQNMETNRRYSEMIGDMTIESGSRQENNYGASTGKNEQARALIKDDEIRRTPFEKAYAIVRGLSVSGLKVKPQPR